MRGVGVERSGSREERGFPDGFFRHFISGKSREQARKVIFQQVADEAKKPKQEDGGECESDKIGSAWCPQVGNAPPCRYRCHLCHSRAILPESRAKAECGRTACLKRLRQLRSRGRGHLSAQEG